MSTSLSLIEARRIALAAQGFADPRPPRATVRHLRNTIRRLGLVQIDCVNVVCAAHYMVPFSRLGPYDRTAFEHLVYRTGQFAEHWAHEISIVPVETWPLLRYRRETDRVRPWGFSKVLEQHADYARWVLDEVRRRGPIAADELPAPDGAAARIPGTWIGTVQRGVLEAHFLRGALAVSGRRSDFSRLYDLAERLIPDDHRTVHVEYNDGRRALLLEAARAHGVGTAKDLADYFRMPVSDAKPRLRELVDSGELLETNVGGWREVAYLHPKAELPRRIEAMTLLSPFDPLIWYRPRAERLFGFEYRVEIFVPPEKRRYGFYVLPFLLGENLVARVDLKADRANGRLNVVGKWYEGRRTKSIADALSAELRLAEPAAGVAQPRATQAPFAPEEFKDEYCEQLQAMIAKKLEQAGVAAAGRTSRCGERRP